MLSTGPSSQTLTPSCRRLSARRLDIGERRGPRSDREQSPCGGIPETGVSVAPNHARPDQEGARMIDTETVQPSPTEGTDPRRWFALAAIAAAQFMVVLDIAIVNVALPSIQRDLHISSENLQWVITAYAIVFGGFLLLGGRLADLLGRRRVFLGGLALFTVASLFNGLAWSEGSLIAFRALQGLGGAMLSPAALSILTTSFPEGRERNVALGVWGAVAGSGAAAGTLLGGVLTSGLGWSWIFFV